MRGGKYAQSYDMPERIDSILSAISERDLGPIIAPDDAGLEPVSAVHHEDMIQYLATAYTQFNMDSEDLTPVFPDYFPPPGQRQS